jgi:membrane protease YdiL (CAAX protease family)
MDFFIFKYMVVYINFLKKLHKKLGLLKLFFITLLIWLGFSRAYLILKSLIINNEYDTIYIFDDSLISKIFEVVIFGPLVETFILQYLVIIMTKRFLKAYSILLSALLFALFHRDLYMLLYFFTFGFILASLYYFFRYHTKERAFLITFLLHAFWNLYTVLANHYFT